MADYLPWVLTLSLVGAAAVWDLYTGHIPNRLTFAGLACGAVLQLAVRTFHARPEGSSLLTGLALTVGYVIVGVLVCGAVPYVLFTRRAMGGGDVKLLAAVGACLGPLSGLQVELYSFIAMALFAPARLAYEGRLLQMLGHSFAIMVNPMLPKGRRRQVEVDQLSSYKFGPAVLAGTILAMLLSWRAS